VKRLNSQGGLTLIELLVTMVLLGFVVALMSGAFVQIAQMLRISSEHANGFTSRWTESRALQDIIANLVADPDLDQPLQGTASRVALTSLSLAPVASGVAQRALLELRVGEFSAGTDQTTALLLRPPEEAFERRGEKPFELARFSGRLVFVYLDSKGREHKQWPPLGSTQLDRLPTAVGMRDEASQGAWVQIAHYQGVPTNRVNNGLAGMFGSTR
jgi:general secretion pathway protein J